MKNKKQPVTSKTSKAKTSSTTAPSFKKTTNDKPHDKNKNKSQTPVKSDKIKENMVFDFKELLKPSEITTNEKVSFSLYLELMNNLDKKDDLKTLAICRAILAQDPTNTKIKELHDIIYESVKDNYYKTGQLEPPKEEKMDKHMKLNKDGEYEYYFSDESEDEK
mgnify:CR=1 FL=1